MSAKPIVRLCPIEDLPVLNGGRWKIVILWWLLHVKVPLRFTILRTKMPRISRKVLTQQLRELERDGLIKRQMFAEMPVRVEYSLALLGRKPHPVRQVRRSSWARKTHAAMVGRDTILRVTRYPFGSWYASCGITLQPGEAHPD